MTPNHSEQARPFTEKKALAISNDISEGCLSPKTSKKDLINSILYWRDRFDAEFQAHRETKDKIFALAYEIAFGRTP